VVGLARKKKKINLEMTTAGREYNEAIGQSVAVKGYQYNSQTIYLKRTIRDIDKDSFKFYSSLYHIQSNGMKILPLSPPIEVPKVDVDAMSLDSSFQVKMSNNSEGKCCIEIFHYQSLKYRLDTSDLHERVIGDEWFGGYSFSPNGRYFVYVAGPFSFCPLCLIFQSLPLSLSSKKRKSQKFL
jgi:hypothetical protein